MVRLLWKVVIILSILSILSLLLGSCKPQKDLHLDTFNNITMFVQWVLSVKKCGALAGCGPIELDTLLIGIQVVILHVKL